MIGRILVVSLGLLFLLIIFVVVKNLVVKGPDYAPFVSIVQDQQELIHLTTTDRGTNSIQTSALSIASQNFAATTQLSVSSSQSKLLTYLTALKQEVTTLQINAKVDPKIDEQLTAASASGTYDQTYKEIMKAQLTAYMTNLQRAYQTTSGVKGHALLNSDFEQAKLLLNQLEAETR